MLKYITFKLRMGNIIDFTCFYELRPALKKYSWGSVDKIHKIIDLKADGKPLAEIWMGNHAVGMTTVLLGGGESLSMSDFINASPEKILGKSCAGRFDSSLPFLFKMLAVEKPLSLQAHPCKSRAEEGFLRENSKNIPLDSPKRNYKDSNRKREMIFPVSEFLLMKGFRTPEKIKYYFSNFLGDTGRRLVDFDFFDEHEFYELFLKRIYSLKKEELDDMLSELRTKKAGLPMVENVIFMKLSINYPEDPSIFAPFFLNCFLMKPGECLLVNEGELHCYVEGTCFELMSASDNVLRGGLTDKNIDVDELLKVVGFEEGKQSFVRSLDSECEKRYLAGEDEFYFSEIIPGDKVYSSDFPRNIEMIFILSGTGTIKNGSCSMDLKKGCSMLIPAAAGRYHISGSKDLVVYKAAVPL